ncbi:transcriptional regulator [Kitasatospora purpeofusca]|uniref:transcriptional regulator n=1 Tax=Kitasatospora purpeofusca TaxID=67352 RepID=UPI0036D3A7DB
MTNPAARSATGDQGAEVRATVGFRPPDGSTAHPVAAEPGWTPGAAVERLARERVTGALHGPAGTVYLVDGLVAHAESDRAPDLATVLTACGRLTRETWREAVHRFGPHARVGEALVEQGRLTRGELELCHLGALYDAACFLLDAPGGAAPTDGPAAPAAPGRWTFAPGARHWLGPVAAVGAQRLRREAQRRQHVLDRIWPSAQFDTAPLCRTAAPPTAAPPTAAPPTAAAPGRHARRLRPPTRRQCELLDHADGRRTPAELARLLGRSAFATTADVRRLAAAGLLVGPDTGCAAGAAAATPGPPGGVPAPRDPGGLHRRVPGAALAALTGERGGPDPAAVPPTDTDPDIALLIRVRTLLEARL